MTKCSECEYYEQTDVAQGECRKRAAVGAAFPMMAQMAGIGGSVQLQVHGYWPPVKGEQGCHEGMMKEDILHRVTFGDAHAITELK